MPHFRKKPIVIEARRLETTHLQVVKLAEWCGGRVSTDTNDDFSNPMHFIYLPTLEGRMLVSPGDWVIQGVNGEFYPCKPDIFEKTYDIVED